MNPQVIVIDGKSYNSVNEMPPDVREKYEQAMRSLGDANGNRIPDAFETINILADKDKNGVPDVLENIVASSATINSMKIIVDGKEFNGLESLPPEARARYDESMGKLDANRNGIPDFIEGMVNTTNQTTEIAANVGMKTQPRSIPQPVNATITPDTSNGWMLALAGLFLLLICAAGTAGAWYFFLR